MRVKRSKKGLEAYFFCPQVSEVRPENGTNAPKGQN